MSDAPVLILTAVRPEAKPLVERLSLRAVETGDQPQRIFEGETGFGSCTLAVTGMGPRAASSVATRMIEPTRPRLVVIAGLAGALSGALQPGDLVIPERVIDSVTGRIYERAASIKKTGRLVTVDRVVTRPTDKASLRDRFEAAAADMESAAIAAVCESQGIPWLCVRAISDSASQRLPARIDRLVDDEGTPLLGRAIGHAITHPMDIPALIRLGRQTRLATETLAESLPGLITQATAEPPAARL